MKIDEVISKHPIKEYSVCIGQNEPCKNEPFSKWRTLPKTGDCKKTDYLSKADYPKGKFPRLILVILKCIMCISENFINKLLKCLVLNLQQLVQTQHL